MLTLSSDALMQTCKAFRASVLRIFARMLHDAGQKEDDGIITLPLRLRSCELVNFSMNQWQVSLSTASWMEYGSGCDEWNDS